MISKRMTRRNDRVMMYGFPAASGLPGFFYHESGPPELTGSGFAGISWTVEQQSPSWGRASRLWNHCGGREMLRKGDKSDRRYPLTQLLFGRF